MTIDFNDEKQYRAFVEAVAQEVLCQFQFDDELDRNIGDAIINYRLNDLAQAVFDKLIAKAKTSQPSLRTPIISPC